MFSISNRSSHRRRERRRVGCCTLIPSVYWPYIMTQHRRAIRSVCRRRCAKRLAEIKQGAGPRAHLRSPRIRLRRRLIIIIFQWFIEGVTGGTGRFANRPGAQKFCPWRSVECLEAPGRTADRRSLRAEYRPYANSGYRGVCALFIGVDCGRFDFESLDMNAPMRAATSSGFSSSAKWPASIRWTSASGISRL